MPGIIPVSSALYQCIIPVHMPGIKVLFQCPDEELSVRLGGPLSTLRTEAADLLQLFTRLS